MTRRVAVVWCDAPVDADVLLADEVHRFCDGRLDPLITRLCPTCGSSTHGRPVVAGHPDLHVSLARAGVWTLAAVSSTGPVGVDVELADPPDPGAVQRVARHPLERGADARGAALQWARKESLLKATGHGLRLPPGQVRLTDPGAPPQLLEWPTAGGAPPTVRMTDLALPGAVVGAVTLLLASEGPSGRPRPVGDGGWVSLRRAPATSRTREGDPSRSPRPRPTSPAGPAGRSPGASW